MNQSCNLIYENYQKQRKILAETPVYGDAGEFNAPERIKEHQPVLNGKPQPSGYAIGQEAQKQGKDIVAVTKQIIDKIKTDIFTQASNIVGGKTYDLYFPGEPDEFREKVKNIIVNVLGLDPTKGNINAVHASRIIAQVIRAVEQKSGASATTPKAPRVTSSPGVVASSSTVDQAKTSEAAINAIKEAEVIKPTIFKLSEEYVVERDIAADAYNKIPNEIRRENAKVNRSRLIKAVGNGYEGTGNDLVKALKLPYSDAKTALIDLLNIGAITVKPKASDLTDIELPDTDDDYRSDLADLQRSASGGMSDRHIRDVHESVKKKLIAETYAPYSVLNKLGSSLKQYSPHSYRRAEAKTELTFGKNVNEEYDKFRAWLKTQPDSRPTGNSLATFFKTNFDFQPANSPTLQKYAGNNPIKDPATIFLQVAKEFERSQSTAATTAPASNSSSQPPPIPKSTVIPAVPKSAQRTTGSPIKLTEEQFKKALMYRGMKRPAAENILKILKLRGAKFI